MRTGERDSAQSRRSSRDTSTPKERSRSRRRLDTLVEGQVIPPPDVVKIDVEGAELSVLRGARAIMRANRPVVVLSTHGFDSHESCCSLLSSLGYAVTLLEHSLPTTGFDYLGELIAEPTDPTAVGVAHS